MYQQLLYLLVQIVPMSIFSDNLRFLREKKDLSQQKLADKLIITRIRLAKYEQGVSEPPFDVLQRLSKFYNVSIDILISVNLRKYPIDGLLSTSENRILLPITVDKQGKDNIEIVQHKAKAGYLSGYSDPEFIEDLQHMHLPFIGQGKHRAFPIEGDSMPPHKNGSFIIGRYVDKINDIKEGKTYVVLSKSEGIIYKRIAKKNKKSGMLLLQSDNPVYKPYEIKATEVLEVWEYVCSFCTKEFHPEELEYENIRDMFRELRTEIKEVKAHLA